MSVTSLFLLIIAVLIVATGLLAVIARLLYTLREKGPIPYQAAPPWPSGLPAERDAGPHTPLDFPPAYPAALSAEDVADATQPHEPAPPVASAVPASLTSPSEPVFYEYTEAGLVPVDPHAPAPQPPSDPAPAEPAAPVSGDSDPNVTADQIEPEEEGFVWL